MTELSNGTGDRLTVVAVTHNSGCVIADCLKQIRHVLGDHASAVVVDNASHDDSIRAATEAAPWARIVALPENLGFGRACNRGVAESTADWILFLNPDVTIVRAAVPSRAPAPFGVGACLLRSTAADATTFLVRRESGAVDDFVRETCLRFLPPALARRWPRPSSPAGWASGALMLVRRSEFLAIGGFDERFFLYYEDRDLARRCRQAGMPITYVPDVAGTHPAGGSTTVINSRREALSLAGWLEYTGIWRGQAAAVAAARRALRVLRGFSTVLSRVPFSKRARAKAGQATEILAHLERLDDYLPRVEEPVLPHARGALQAAFAQSSRLQGQARSSS